MKIQILEGNASKFDQRTIDDAKGLKLIYQTDNYKDALNELVQLLNDEALDVTNNFHTIREV